MTQLLKHFTRDESGATAIEYGLIAALIALAIMAGAGYIGEEMSTTFNSIGDELSGANGGE